MRHERECSAQGRVPVTVSFVRDGDTTLVFLMGSEAKDSYFTHHPIRFMIILNLIYIYIYIFINIYIYIIHLIFTLIEIFSIFST